MLVGLWAVLNIFLRVIRRTSVSIHREDFMRWGSKIWPWVLRDFDPRVTALARPRSNHTVTYRPVFSPERALQNNKAAAVWRNFQGERKIGRGSQKTPDNRTDWPTDCRS
jgi:hypothetical protein